MSNKILVPVFVVLFFVLLAEFSYLFYFSKKPGTSIRISLPGINNITPTPTPPQPIDKNGVQAITDDTLIHLSKHMSVAKQGVISSSVLKNHYEGTITQLGKSNNPETDYSLRIVFQGKNGVANGFLYSHDEIENKVQIFQKKKGGLERTDINGLKAGNMISIDEELNLLVDDDLNNLLIKVTITVLK